MNPADAIGETSLDVEWSHAVAPGANILLVQAKSMNLSDLMAAVDWARHQPGVSVVSMSWAVPNRPRTPSTTRFSRPPPDTPG